MTSMPQLTITKAAGIGLRSRHIAEMLSRRPSAGWLEVHAENYMGESAQVAALEKLRQIYPLSVHGVGLSLGSANGLDRDHLNRLRIIKFQQLTRLTESEDSFLQMIDHRNRQL